MAIRQLNDTKFLLAALLSTLLAACGGSSGGSNDSGSAQFFDDTVRFRIGELSPDLIDAPMPSPSNTVEQPRIFSAPGAVEVSLDSVVQIELGYSVTALLNTLYVGQRNANEHLSFSLDAVGNGSVSQQTVVFTVSLPSGGETHCYEVAVGDVNANISEPESICIEAINGENSEEARTIYFADFSSNSTLSSVALDTGNVSVVGSTGRQLTDIAFLGLTLYGIGSSLLYEIDLETGVATSVGLHGYVGANALEGHEGILYAADVQGNIFSIDPLTLESSLIGEYDAGAYSSGDLVIVPDQEGVLYGTVKVIGQTTDSLVSINVLTGESTVIGDTGFVDVWGLAFFRDQLVGLTDSGQFILIDESTGRSALVSEDAALSAGGATVDKLAM